MSPCERTHEQLHHFIDGTLDAAQAVEMSAHLDLCPSCLRELQALKTTVALLRSAPTPDGKYAKQRALIALQHTATTHGAPRLFFRPFGSLASSLRWAAASLAMATLLLLTFHPSSEPGAVQQTAPILIAGGGGGHGLPTSAELDEMVSLHAVHSIAVASGDDGIQQDTLAEANSRLHHRNP